MDAAPLLARIAELLDRHKLEAVLIGNAAAALQGAPSATRSIDFALRHTAPNLIGMQAIAQELDAALVRPYPSSRLRRIVCSADALQIDWWLMARAPFRTLLTRATPVRFCDVGLLLAAAGPDPASSGIGTRWESDMSLRDQIRALLALPPEQRTHFLRKRVGIRMSCL